MKKAAHPLRDRIVPVAAAGAVLAILGALGWYGLEAISSQPVRQVHFAGELGRIARADLEAFAQGVQGAASQGASLGAVREAARRIPWVREATVRRRFPDAVEVTFQAHEPLARWDEGALVSERGEIFHAEYAGALPRFNGPPGAGVAMAREYAAIAAAVAPVSRTIAELRLSKRGAWQVVLDSGLVLDVGRGDLLPRLERFAAAWPQLAAQGVEMRHADLRYPNGFAVKR